MISGLPLIILTLGVLCMTALCALGVYVLGCEIVALLKGE